MYPTRKRGRPPKEEPKFPDVSQMSDLTEARQPLSPPKAELFAQAIVRLNGDVRRACAEVLDPLSDPSYTEFEKLPTPIQKRVKYLLNRAATETVADRKEIELLLTKVIRGQEDNIEPIDAVRELCKMKGWYSPVEHHNVHELRIPDRVAGMSDAELDRMIELGKQVELEDKSKEVEAEVVEVVEVADTTGSVILKEVEDGNAS
jgi:hypothetical protein